MQKRKERFVSDDPICRCCDSDPVVRRTYLGSNGKHFQVLLCNDHKNFSEFTDPRNLLDEEPLLQREIADLKKDTPITHNKKIRLKILDVISNDDFVLLTNKLSEIKNMEFTIAATIAN